MRDQTWKPKNYRDTFYGPTLLREALAQSRNVVTVKILQDIGVDYTIDYARKLGITTDLTRTLSLALGVVGGVAVRAHPGLLGFRQPGAAWWSRCSRLKIVDRDGTVLEEAAHRPPAGHREGHGLHHDQPARERGPARHGPEDQGPGPAGSAGKTGTTNDMYDAWYSGTPGTYVAGVWVGFDTEAPLGKTETGAVAASPIWLGFMKRVLANQPVRNFEPSEGIVFAKIDAETGLLPVPESRKTIFECFKDGTVPIEYTQAARGK